MVFLEHVQNLHIHAEKTHCAHRASILRSKIDARPWAISINQVGCDREKVFLDFLDLARAHRGLFRRCSQQGAQNGPPPPSRTRFIPAPLLAHPAELVPLGTSY